MVNLNAIKKQLLKHFRIEGTANIHPETGVVDVKGSISMKKQAPQFPVKFGTVAGSFHCDNMGLTTLEGGPTHVGGSYYCFQNPLRDLNGLADHVESILQLSYDPELPLLRVMNAGMVQFYPYNEKAIIVGQIINGNLGKGKGKAGALKAAGELIRAGYKANARW